MYGKVKSQGGVMALTAKQKVFLDFILSSLKSRGYAPTHAEIAKHFGFSSRATVTTYLEILERKGYLRREAHAWQGVEVLVNPAAPAEPLVPQIPVLGKVAAGRPIEALKVGQSVEVPAQMVKGFAKGFQNYFALEVEGDSMIGDGILDRDIVVVQRQPTAEQGQIVIAEVDHEATIKRFYKKKKHIELHSSNPKYPPILVYPGQDFKISGHFCGLLRFGS
jgi:repressor LexA